MPAHFADEPAQVMGQADLDRANTKLQHRDEEKDNSDDGIARNSTNPANGATGEKLEKLGTYDKYELGEDDCYEELGFCFPNKKKWYIVTIIFWVQVSMNFNTSLYSNAIGGISEEFGVSAQGARCGAMIFLVTYAFGCELWAPWSEEFGRWPILQLSMLLVNIWQLPVALAPNFATIMVGRALGGLSTAGGSVTLGMIADMWEADTQQYAVAYVVFSSVFGSVLGPIVGGFCEQYLAWRLVPACQSLCQSLLTRQSDGASGSNSSSAASSKPSTSSPSPKPAQQSCSTASPRSAAPNPSRTAAKKPTSGVPTNSSPSKTASPPRRSS
jgi:hypothetical protein